MKMPAKKHKYGAKKTTVDGITFDSKAEAAYYRYLKRQQAKRKVASFEMQKTYELMPKFKHPKTGKVVRAIKYIPDFVVNYADGRVEVIDIKGVQTETFKLKAKLFMAKYQIPLVLIKYDDKTGLFYEL